MRGLGTVLILGLVVVPADAATFTVGAGGGYPTIQTAIEAALRRGGDNEIRVAAGEWPERIAISDAGSAGRLTLSGGWDETFSGPAPAPAATVIDGGGLAPVVDIQVQRLDLTLTTLTIVKGNVPAVPTARHLGGGVRLRAAGRADVLIRNVLFSENRLTNPADAFGGGLSAQLAGGAQLRLEGNQFEGNSVTSGLSGSYARGGGAHIEGQGSSRIVVADNRFVRNEAETLAPANGGPSALNIFVGDSSRAEVTDNWFSDNEARAPAGRATIGTLACNLFGHGGAGPRLVGRRNRLLHNRGSDLALTSQGPAASMTFSDCLVAAGTGAAAVVADTYDGGVIVLNNLTVTANIGFGILGDVHSPVSIANTIVFGNQVPVGSGGGLIPADDPVFDHGAPVVLDRNLIGSDPRFVNPAGDDYRLELLSPAIDAGDNHPAGGLGPLDLGLAPRIQGTAVDVGAYETHAECRVLFPGVGRDTQACRCFSDPGLLELRCGFRMPDVFMTLRLPRIWTPGLPVQGDWTIDPRANVAGPYSMEVSTLLGEKWIPQTWLGPTRPALSPHQRVSEPFQLLLPEVGRTPLRTTLSYGLGKGLPSRMVEVEVLLPDPAEASK